jgi:hypothetical protein
MNYFYFFYFFILFLLIRTVVFCIVSRNKKEKQWNKRFYNCVEVFEDSYVDPSIFWSFLTDSKKIMNFDYKNKVKWVVFEQPLKLGSIIKIRLRKRYGFKGCISFFSQESRIVFEYHVWPSETRYICEIEMIRLEDKIRYILRMKAKNLLVPLIVPLIKRLWPKLDVKMKSMISEILHNCLEICKKNQQDLTMQTS